MIRKTIPALFLLIAISAFGQNRAPNRNQTPGTTVTGVVTAVNGTTISLANGLVALDVSHATITNDHGKPATIAPGSQIFAILSSNTSLVASSVIVSSQPQVTLSGPVQSVDASAGTLQLLGLTIHTDSNTSFGGSHNIRGVSDIVANDIVAIQANASGSSLLATAILVFAPLRQVFPTVLHGTVKTIGTDSWVITDTRRGDTTVLVNAQTKILGSPKVGDTVDVLANVDSANNFVAISISVSPVNNGLHFTGVVKQIGSHSWVIGPGAGLGPDRIVQVTSQTQIVGNPQVGDSVDVVLDPNSALNVALSITKL